MKKSKILTKFLKILGVESYIEEKILAFYKNETLKVYRVWGAEERLVVGDDVHLNNAVINTISGKVKVGDRTFFGHNVSLLTGTHNYRKVGVERQLDVPTEGRDIIIGEGVWIASNTIILGPCTIPDNTVISAGTVITGELECNAIYSTVSPMQVKEIRIT
jgi:acetyltransferase-like isoleucine patch superfamily enzyme